MANREKIAIGEYYHVYNRGVDKRTIFEDKRDMERFMQSLQFFNSKEPVKSLRESISLLNSKNFKKHDRLVELICYVLNPNHYHFLLREIKEGGISEFMKRVGGGYTWYFNNRHHRSGALFQGVFKYVRVVSNEQLLYLSAYINLNYKIHKISGETAGRVKSSWQEYIGESSQNICTKEIILSQFKSVKDYRRLAESFLREIMKSRKDKSDSEMLVGKHFY